MSYLRRCWKKVKCGSERREIAKDLVDRRTVSIRRACRLMGIDPKTYHSRPKQSIENERIRSRLKYLSAQYPRYGFRKLFELLRGEGMKYNHKRVHRIM